MITKAVAKVWTFESSSSSKTYETLQYTDESTSCNCMGWTRRVAADGSRSCKHTRLVDQGLADSHCVSSKNYAEPTPKKVAPTPKPVSKPKVIPKEKQVGTVVRKIQWN